jgi:hypothetical protein
LTSNTTLWVMREDTDLEKVLPLGHPQLVICKMLTSVDIALTDITGLGDSYAIIAYGDAASICLEVAVKPIRHCCALVCYYPSQISRPNQTFPSQLELVVHLAERQRLTANFPTFVYPDVEEGFAELDLDDIYDSTAAGLAWTRSLTAIRRAFKQYINIESVKDRFTALTTNAKDVTNAMSTTVGDPHVNFVATGTGGIGRRALLHFYKDFFVTGNPPSLKRKLISRTVGVDRVVDEMIISFKHTQRIHWMLPGVPPTNKFVQIAIVSIVAVRGGKLVSEHVYWDQASVLAQIGALDAKNVPRALSSKGCKRLPILGREEAQKVENSRSTPSNELIEEW